jgi:hypothetical protein
VAGSAQRRAGSRNLQRRPLCGADDAFQHLRRDQSDGASNRRSEERASGSDRSADGKSQHKSADPGRHAAPVKEFFAQASSGSFEFVVVKFSHVEIPRDRLVLLLIGPLSARDRSL